jgi:hypothetical protein
MSIFRNERLENPLSARIWSLAVKTAGKGPGDRSHPVAAKAAVAEDRHRAARMAVTGQQRKEKPSDAH